MVNFKLFYSQMKQSEVCLNGLTPYGREIVLFDPNPPKSMIRGAKRQLVRSMRWQEDYRKLKFKSVKFTIKKNYELIDPDTGETELCSSVGITVYA